MLILVLLFVFSVVMASHFLPNSLLCSLFSSVQNNASSIFPSFGLLDAFFQAVYFIGKNSHLLQSQQMFFVEYISLDWLLKSLRVWNALLQIFLGFKVSIGKSDIILVGFSLHVTYIFSLITLNTHSLLCILSALSMIYYENFLFLGLSIWYSVCFLYLPVCVPSLIWGRFSL